jgi:hypothetical protein
MPDHAALFRPARAHPIIKLPATTPPPASRAGSETSMPGPDTAPSDTPAPRAALVALAAALDPRDFTTTLTAPPGRPPRLSVTSRHAAIGDDIYADHQAYWWSWAERIAAIGNPDAAASKISAVLHATPQPTHG